MLLDALRMQRRLREVGFPDQQADALTEEVANIVTGELATKGDLSALRTEMLEKFAETDSKIAEVRSDVAEVKSDVARLEGKIAELQGTVASHQSAMAGYKTGIIKWLVGIVAAVLLGCGGMTAAMIITLIRVAG